MIFSQVIKGKYEAILGFATLIISLSAFKEELQKISVDLGFLSFSLSEYLLGIIFGFCLCLYLYIIEHMARDTKFGSLKIFDLLTRIGFLLFAVCLISPIMIVLTITLLSLFHWLGDLLTHLSILDSLNRFNDNLISKLTANTIALLIAFSTSIKFATSLYDWFRNTKFRKAEEEEIIALDLATKLFNDDYYSQSLLETYKAIVFHLHKKLLGLGLTVSPNRFDDILYLSKKHEIINSEDLSFIADLRGIRNATSHTNEKTTREFSKQALLYVKSLISRDKK